MQNFENWAKITSLLQSGDRDNIELAYQLAGKQVPLFWPILRNLKDILFNAKTQPRIDWLEMPLGQLCYISKVVLAMSFQHALLKKLPTEISFFRSLTILEINNCHFEELPETLGQLTRLKSLSIKNTPVLALPNQIIELPNLQTLILRNTNLHALPQDLNELKTLKHLEIFQNTHLQIPPQTLTKLSHLESITIDKNLISAKEITALQQSNIKLELK